LVFLREVKDPVKEAARLARLAKDSNEISTAKRTHFGEHGDMTDEKMSVKDEAFVQTLRPQENFNV
jgi:hypothetical protein